MPGSSWSRWRSHFQVHPGWDTRQPSSIANPQAKSSGHKPKVICIECLQRRLTAEEQKDDEDIRTLLRQIKRTRAIIECELWAAEDGTIWLQGRTETMLRHLKRCHYVSEDIRADATAECQSKNLNISPSKPPSQHQFSSSGINPIPIFSMGPPAPSLSVNASSSQNPFLATPTHASFHNYSPLNSAPVTATGTPLSPLSFTPPPGTPLSATYSHLSDYNPSKRARLSRHSSHGSITVPIWTSTAQDEFNSSISRITASCGFPHRWIEDPEVIHFIARFIPQAIVPSRYVLANRFIPAEVDKFRVAAKQSTRGQFATLQCDGWTGGNFHHLLAFMMTTSNREINTISVHDTSADRKTAEQLLLKIRETIIEVREGWGVKVVAVTSDASGESRRARSDLIAERPDLIAPDCYAHQINLILRDGFKTVGAEALLDVADQAVEVIGWLRGKTYVLAQIRIIQTSNKLQILAVIRAVLTRWTAHYLAFKRLLQLKISLEMLITQNEAQATSQIITGKRAAQDLAKKMIGYIKQPLFWHGLPRIKKYIEPLTLAANITQIVHVRLDQVLLVFGHLYREYTMLMRDEVDFQSQLFVNKIFESLEKRWKKAGPDQKVFIAAVILNPLYKTSPFISSHHNSLAGVLQLFKDLWIRFFHTYTENEEQELYNDVHSYLISGPLMSAFAAYIPGYLQRIKTTKESPDPLAIWDSIRSLNQTNSTLRPLHRLAHHIFSICANSASCERLFSMFGNTLTKLRSRLSTKRMLDQAELRMHLRDERLRQGRFNENLRENSRRRKMTTHQAEVEEPAPQAVSNEVEDDVNTETDDESGGISDSHPSADRSPTSQRPKSLRNLINHAVDAGEDSDDTDSTDLVCIADLFDFDNPQKWSDYIKQYSLQGLDKELELYDLVEMDAEGDDDIEDSLDSMTEAALSI